MAQLEYIKGNLLGGVERESRRLEEIFKELPEYYIPQKHNLCKEFESLLKRINSSYQDAINHWNELKLTINKSQYRDIVDLRVINLVEDRFKEILSSITKLTKAYTLYMNEGWAKDEDFNSAFFRKIREYANTITKQHHHIIKNIYIDF